MKLFQQKTVINKCETAKEFAEAYQIGKGDFILASKSTYDAYFTPLGLDASCGIQERVWKRRTDGCDDRCADCRL